MPLLTYKANVFGLRLGPAKKCSGGYMLRHPSTHDACPASGDEQPTRTLLLLPASPAVDQTASGQRSYTNHTSLMPCPSTDTAISCATQAPNASNQEDHLTQLPLAARALLKTFVAPGPKWISRVLNDVKDAKVRHKAAFVAAPALSK